MKGICMEISHEMLVEKVTSIVTRAKRLQKDIVQELVFCGVEISEVTV